MAPMAPAKMIPANYSKPMLNVVRLIHSCKFRVNVSFNGMLKIKHDTFPGFDLLYFIYGFACLLGSFSFHLCHHTDLKPANKMG